MILLGRRNSADVIKVKNLEIGGLSWVIQAGRVLYEDLEVRIFSGTVRDT